MSLGGPSAPMLVAEDGEYYVVDQGSRCGTFVNRVRREKQKLQANDRLDFGADDIAWVIFNPSRPQPTSTSAAGEFLSQISMMAMPAGGTLTVELFNTHLNEEDCLQIIVAEGSTARLKAFIGQVRRVKGVKQIKFIQTTAMR